MKIHKIHDVTNLYAIDLLKKEFSTITNEQYIKNYHPDFCDTNSNIFYILNDIHGRYKTGCYYIIEEDEQFVCSAGWNEYEKDIALALTRAYVSPKFRTKFYMGKYILPEIIEKTTAYKNLYITADSFNNAIYQYFVRAEQNKTTALFNDWPDIYKKFKPIGLKLIYNTLQYVASYER